MLNLNFLKKSQPSTKASKKTVPKGMIETKLGIKIPNLI